MSKQQPTIGPVRRKLHMGGCAGRGRRRAVRLLGIEQLEARTLLSASFPTVCPAARMTSEPDLRLDNTAAAVWPQAMIGPALSAAHPAATNMAAADMVAGHKVAPALAVELDHRVSAPAADQIFTLDSDQEPTAPAPALQARAPDDTKVDVLATIRLETAAKAALVPSIPADPPVESANAEVVTQPAPPPDLDADDAGMTMVMRTLTADESFVIVDLSGTVRVNSFGPSPFGGDDAREGLMGSAGHDAHSPPGAAGMQLPWDVPPPPGRSAAAGFSGQSSAANLGVSATGKAGAAGLPIGLANSFSGLDGLAAIGPPAVPTDLSAGANGGPLDFDAGGLRGATAGGSPRSVRDLLAADVGLSFDPGQTVQLAPAGKLGWLDAMEAAYAQDAPQPPAAATPDEADAATDDLPAITIQKTAAAEGLIDFTCALTAPVQVARLVPNDPAASGSQASGAESTLAAEEPIGLDRLRDTARSFQLLSGPERLVAVPAVGRHAAPRHAAVGPAPKTVAAAAPAATPVTAGLGSGWASHCSAGLAALLAVGAAVGRRAVKSRATAKTACQESVS